MPLEHRLQILLDDERHARITSAARERGVSVATVVREAIDRGVAGSAGRREAAGRRLLEAPDMDVPEQVGELKAELAALRARRARSSSTRPCWSTPRAPSTPCAGPAAS